MLLAALAGLGPASAATEGPAAEPDRRLLEAVNAARAVQGLPPLAASPRLAALAAAHSRAMAAAGRLGHGGFAERFDRAAAALCVENVAHGFGPAETVVQGWLRTDPHRGNLLEARVHEAGVAVHGAYVTYLACERGP